MLVANLVYPIYRSLRQNSGLAVLSVVLAFGVWIVVTEAENPETTQVLQNVDIPVEPIDVPSDVAVDSIDPATVRVRVRVEEDVVDTLTAADFEATVDLQGFAVGDYERPVAVRALTSRGGLRVEEVIPSEVSVSIVALSTVVVDVVIDAQGEPPPGFSLVQVQPEEETVLVSGPASRVNTVTQATATLNIAGRSETFEQSVRLEARDERGLLVTGVSLNPALVAVSVEIAQETFSRPVVVSPIIVGEPADGYRIVSVSVDPPTVTITGPEELIESEESIETEAINIDGQNNDVQRTVSLVAPTEVDVIPEGTRVTVTIEIGPREGDITIRVPLSVENVPSGLTVSGTLPMVEVTLGTEGPGLVLDPSEVIASVDLEDASAGTVQVNVEVSAPEGFTVAEGGVSPAQVTITLAES